MSYKGSPIPKKMMAAEGAVIKLDIESQLCFSMTRLVPLLNCQTIRWKFSKIAQSCLISNN